MCLNTGTPKNINFSFETNGKLMALGVPILKHFRVIQGMKAQSPASPDFKPGFLFHMTYTCLWGIRSKCTHSHSAVYIQTEILSQRAVKQPTNLDEMEKTE